MKTDEAACVKKAAALGYDLIRTGTGYVLSPLSHISLHVDNLSAVANALNRIEQIYKKAWVFTGGVQ